ncbi:MAG: glycoside hydrolase family 27 protein [Opitutales bacterium]|nr:glycoside hydrolase family 27 protein [Opitutales bacterium]
MKKALLSAVALLAAACPVLAQKFEGLALTPPMGWNSWNTFEVNIHEDMIKEMADILVESGMKDAGYTYIVVDDGWEALERDEKGQLVPDPEKFPNGMKALADYVHSKGLKFGIHNCAGKTTCNGFPGGRGHEFEDARIYASWGVDYLKYDWCDHGDANSKETYSTMRDALYAAGRPIVFSLCEWGDTKPWEWAQDVGHLWRTTGDITDCFDCQGEYDMGLKYVLGLQVGLQQYAGPDHWNDPDMLEVGNPGLTLTESRAHFSLWCMLAAPLMAGNDLTEMTPEVLEILTNREAIAIDQDALGKQAYQYMAHPNKQIWIKELSDGDWAICYFNDGKDAYTQRINWEHYTFLDGTYTMRDIWKHADVGTTDKKYEFRIESHDVLLLRLSKVK